MIRNFAGERKVVARPTFQFRQSRFTVARLPGLMIFAADNQNIAFIIARKSQVMIRNRTDHMLFFVCCLGCVPQEHVLYLPRHAQRQYISSIGRLLGMDDKTIIDRTIGCDNGCLRPNGMPL